jgi:DNA-binding IclR family transcriptional regulator
LPDWLFGSPNRKRLLELLLLAEEQARAWRQAEIAKALGAHPKGSVDEHLHALVQLGLLERLEGPPRFRLVAAQELPTHLRHVRRGLRLILLGLQDVPDDPVARPGPSRTRG